MDFFERQDKARKNTKLLTVYFVFAVVCIIASVYLASLLVFYGVEAKQRHGEPVELTLWRPDLFFYVTFGTLGVIVFGSLYKISALAKGGSAVAETFGARLVNPNTTDPHERKLRNVVEEMALASGVAVPQVYVLDDENGINAFAAGHSPSDAAVCVTHGSMTLLSRDELQGVIGHEFSHILNGDMRLNLRLIGILFGILCLTIIGRILLHTRGRKNPLPLLGIALLIIGALGVFFGRLIQAAVSRQREFLADASAIQFTRNPAGLSGALQKIGGAGSKLESAHAGEACHMFFGNGLAQTFLHALATHPPLEDRIRAIDPGWDGKFKRVSADAVEQSAPRVSPKPARSRFPFPPIIGMPPIPTGAAGFAPNVVQAQSVLPNLGNPTPLHLRYAEELRNSLPESVKTSVREPFDAVALLYALLLSQDESVRATQLKELARQTNPAVHQKTAALFAEVAPIAARTRLPLVNLALPALRQLRLDEFKQFSRTLQWLIESDRQIDLFEFVLQKIIRRHLEPQFTGARPPVAQYYSIKLLLPDCALLLSALAHVSSTDQAEVAKAFQHGAPYLRSSEGGLPLLPRSECGLAQIDGALNRLALAVPQVKKNLIEACVHTVGADGVIQEREAELLRAVADTLDCPIPPFVQIAES